MKYDLNDTSILITVRIDSLERFENLKTITEYILQYFATNIIILEADKANNGLLSSLLSDKIEFIFVEDHDIIFHRTKYINILTMKAKTPFVAVWDSDVIVNPIQIEASVVKLRDASVDFIYPYDGRFVETGVFYRNLFINNYNIKPLEDSCDSMFTPYTSIACGGGFFANKDAYIASGMENENFYGWGPEDGERLKRWKILGMRLMRVKGPMFHLFHPRGVNSMFKSEQKRIELLTELDRIACMTKPELEQEIQSWEWLKHPLC